MRDVIRFVRRGQVVEVSDFHPRTTLLDWLRLTDRATGTKEGCAEGDCGACTIVLRRLRNGAPVVEPVNSCILFLGQADGAEILTVEDLGDPDGRPAGASGEGLHPVQRAMVDMHGSQCGFCTPGIVMSLFALHETAPGPVDRRAIDDALAGNLCRCTGYRPIADAAARACGPERAPPRPLPTFPEADPERDVFVGSDETFFAAPASEASLAALYARHPDAVLVSGATDVGLWATKALRDLPKIIWLGRVAGLDAVEDDGATLTLGATLTHARALPLLAGLDPDIGELLRRFGSVQVRASGTVGGNIANGSPIGDLAPVMIALGAEVELRRGDEVRRVPMEDFFIAYRKQDRRPSEFVRAVRVRRPGRDAAFRCFKVSKRFDEDISAVMGAFHFVLGEAGGERVIRSARIAYGGMAGIPKRAALAEAALAGAPLSSRKAWDLALDAIAGDFSPMSDQRANAAYRGHVARNLLLKALTEVAGASTDRTRIVGRRPPELEAAHGR